MNFGASVGRINCSPSTDRRVSRHLWCLDLNLSRGFTNSSVAVASLLRCCSVLYEFDADRSRSFIVDGRVYYHSSEPKSGRGA